MSEYVVRDGESAEGPFSLVITPKTAGWGYSSLRVLTLAAGESATFPTGEDETVVLPLAGACAVECDGERFELVGRDSVFSRVTDFAYVPRDAQVTVSSEQGGRFALPAARATKRLPARYGPAEGVQVELRGAGQSSRQVNNFCNPASFEAEKLIAVEVLTPESNWSSYPPHKHDEEREGESVLEEIYYFEVGTANSPGEMANSRVGVGFQRVYSSGPGREIDVCTEVRTGDAVLIPHGWHGPSMAAPGYDLYYLNVMAGPKPRPRLADLRRPRARVGSRHLGRPADRPPSAPDHHPGAAMTPPTLIMGRWSSVKVAERPFRHDQRLGRALRAGTVAR